MIERRNGVINGYVTIDAITCSTSNDHPPTIPYHGRHLIITHENERWLQTLLRICYVPEVRTIARMIAPSI
jgi:hypothetical protein